MSIHTSTVPPTQHSAEKPNLNAAIRKRFLQIGFLILLQAVILFASAGRLDWIAGWAYIGLYIAFIALNVVIMLPNNRELIAERSQMKENTKGWDKVIGIFYGLFGPAILIVSGLDERLGWTPDIALWIQVVALVVVALGYVLFAWAMASNKFFSAVVRVQADRGHAVATGGPYRFVRHPGYIGIIASSLATPPMLGSWWGLIPAVLLVCVLIVRTRLEDTTLQKELDGYQDYARQVRYRLVPGLW